MNWLCFTDTYFAAGPIRARLLFRTLPVSIEGHLRLRLATAGVGGGFLYLSSRTGTETTRLPWTVFQLAPKQMVLFAELTCGDEVEARFSDEAYTRTFYLFSQTMTILPSVPTTC